MGPPISMLFQAGVGIEKAARESKEKRTLICPSCRVEYAAGARCCVRCGSKSAITVAALKQRDALAAEEKRRKEEAHRKALHRPQMARRRLELFVLQPFCGHCSKLRDAGTRFCPQCAQPCISPAPREAVYRQLQSEFPDIVRTPADVETVAKTPLPQVEEIGRDALKAVAQGLGKLFR